MIASMKGIDPSNIIALAGGIGNVFSESLCQWHINPWRKCFYFPLLSAFRAFSYVLMLLA